MEAGLEVFSLMFEQKIATKQGRRNVFITAPAKLDHEDYAIKCVGG